MGPAQNISSMWSFSDMLPVAQLSWQWQQWSKMRNRPSQHDHTIVSAWVILGDCPCEAWFIHWAHFSHMAKIKRALFAQLSGSRSSFLILCFSSSLARSLSVFPTKVGSSSSFPSSSSYTQAHPSFSCSGCAPPSHFVFLILVLLLFPKWVSPTKRTSSNLALNLSHSKPRT